MNRRPFLVGTAALVALALVLGVNAGQEITRPIPAPLPTPTIWVLTIESVRFEIVPALTTPVPIFTPTPRPGWRYFGTDKRMQLGQTRGGFGAIDDLGGRAPRDAEYEAWSATYVRGQ